MNPLCAEEGIGLIPCSPLARGLITGSRTREGGATSRARTDKVADRLYTQESDFDVADAVEKVAEAKGISRAQVGLAWLLQRPNVAAPIVGTTKIEHLEDAVKAIEVKLKEEEIKMLEAPYRPHPVLGHE